MKTALLTGILFASLLLLSNQVNAQDYYPLNDGDFWEYVHQDTVTLQSGVLGGGTYSFTKEVIGDTLMPNGITYKKIIRMNAANSVKRAPWYEYERKDISGNIYMYYNNQDYLLYDFSKSHGDTYPSHLPGFNWTVSKLTYNIYGKDRQTFVFDIKDYDYSYISRFLSDSIGMIQYNYSNPYTDPFSDTAYFNSGYIWGAIINGVQYGDLFADKQKIDWSEYYPLHVGDFWVYYGTNFVVIPNIGGVVYPYEKVIKVTSDSTMPDGNKYYCKNGQFERIDTMGSVYAWINNTPTRILQFSATLGDTFNINGDYKLINKSVSDGIRSLLFTNTYVDGNYTNIKTYVFNKGKGLTGFSSEDYPNVGNNISRGLQGAYINGVIYGDISYATVGIEDKDVPLTDYALDQNYPNPFNPTTNINFQLPKDGFVSLVVYNLLGEKVETLVNEYREAGKYTVTFNAQNLPSGVYLYRLQTNSNTFAKKMMLIK